MAVFWVVFFCLIIAVLFYQNASAVVFAIAIASYLLIHSFFSGSGWFGSSLLWIVYFVFFANLGKK